MISFGRGHDRSGWSCLGGAAAENARQRWRTPRCVLHDRDRTERDLFVGIGDRVTRLRLLPMEAFVSLGTDCGERLTESEYSRSRFSFAIESGQVFVGRLSEEADRLSAVGCWNGTVLFGSGSGLLYSGSAVAGICERQAVERYGAKTRRLVSQGRVMTVGIPDAPIPLVARRRPITSENV